MRKQNKPFQAKLDNGPDFGKHDSLEGVKRLVAFEVLQEHGILGAAGRKAAQFDNNPHGGSEDYAFVYLNVRMGKGRSEATQKHAGEILVEVTKKHFADLFVTRHVGITLQIDVGPEVFDHKHSNVHPLFAAL
jgi:5-carboxymethyl-2-hydroxymuconate isomerase